MESVIFLVSLVVKKTIACLTLSEKRTSEAAWLVAFFNSCGLFGWGNFRATESNGLVDHVGLRYVCKLYLVV